MYIIIAFVFLFLFLLGLLGVSMNWWGVLEKDVLEKDKCLKYTLNGTTTCQPVGCTLGCPGFEIRDASSINSAASMQVCEINTEGDTTTCQPMGCAPECNVNFMGNQREQYDLGNYMDGPSILDGEWDSPNRDSNVYCDDGDGDNRDYVCAFGNKCGLGVCIGSNQRRCFDTTEPYICEDGKSCGKGHCTSVGETLCGHTVGQITVCKAGQKCCKSFVDCNNDSNQPCATCIGIEDHCIDDMKEQVYKNFEFNQIVND